MFLASIACPSLTVRGGGGVLVVGSANVDLVAYAPRLPVSGETLAGLSFEQSPGGKGANQAVAAAKLGSDVRFITQLGEDSMGEGSLANYRAAGIDTTHIFRTSEAKTGVALITVNAESGDNTIVVCPGAAGLLDEAQLDAAADAFEQSSVLLTQLEARARVTVGSHLELGPGLGSQLGFGSGLGSQWRVPSRPSVADAHLRLAPSILYTVRLGP